jgi:TonB family protein
MKALPMRVLVLLVTLASAVGHAQYVSSFESVRRSYSKGDFETAMAGFRELSEQGDARAQVLFGLALKEGHHVPRDLAAAYAWLDIAASASILDSEMAASVERTRNELALVLSGRELLAAERLVTDYRERLATRLKQRGEVARKALFSDGSAPSAASAAGCAEDRWLAGCEEARGRSDTTRGCRGEFPNLDAPPVIGGQSASLHVPRVHGPGTLAKETTTVTYALHIDASGFVCRAAIVEGSASHNADQTTLKTVTRWRFRPAASGGTPVESLYVGRLTYQADF